MALMCASSACLCNRFVANSDEFVSSGYLSMFVLRNTMPDDAVFQNDAEAGIPLIATVPLETHAVLPLVARAISNSIFAKTSHRVTTVDGAVTRGS